MKTLRILLTWIVAGLCVLAVPASASDGGAPADFEAIQAYRDGDLETARSLWLDLLEADPPAVAGDDRARVLYNLGNLAVRRQDDLEAVGWYTASLRLRPRDSQTSSNLEFARLNAGLPPADRGDLSATVRVLLTWLTGAEAGWLAIFSLLPLVVAFAFEALRGGRRWRWVTLGTAGLALLGSVPLWFSIARAAADPVLVVAPDGSAVRSEPRLDADLVERVDAGAIVDRVDEFPGWYRVTLDRGRAGWLPVAEAFPLKR